MKIQFCLVALPIGFRAVIFEGAPVRTYVRDALFGCELDSTNHSSKLLRPTHHSDSVEYFL